MKYSKIFSLLTPFFIWVSILGCTEENELNLNLSEVESLLAPEDNLSVALKPAQGGSVIFQWSQARAEDGSLVMYEVAFDQEDGDFSSPFYTVSSDGKGVENTLTLSHTELNNIATLGGADFFEKKKFRWTVFAAKGSNLKPAIESKIIELERPGGFAVLPSQLYVTGSATEGGTDLANALPMKKLEEGIFEIYTRLSSGSYTFVDGNAGTVNSFFIKEEDGFKTISADGEMQYEGDARVYRIRVDFNALSAQTDEVKAVGFWYCWENKIQWELNYAGMGIWRIDNVTVNLSSVPWGLEERHKYRVILNDGTADREEWWGYVENDSPGQDGQYGVTDPSYFHAYLIENNDQWNHAWKLDRTAIQGEQADFLMKFSYGDTPYASEYVIH